MGIGHVHPQVSARRCPREGGVKSQVFTDTMQTEIRARLGEG